MYQNYLFDLYGTLVDIHTDESKPSLWKQLALFLRMQGADYNGYELEKAFCEEKMETQIDTLEKQQLLYSEDISLSEIEINFYDVIETIYKRKNIIPTSDQIKNFALMMRVLSIEYIELFNNVISVLSELKRRGKKLYLLSNAQRLFTEPEMRMLGIYDLFDDVFYSSDIGMIKPSKHFYESLIRKHNLKLEETVMVGNDWQADAWGAANYGLSSFYIHTNQSTPVNGPLPSNCRQLKTIIELLLY